MFLFINHPLAIGLVLLIQTLVIASAAGLILPTFWFSYILFLVFLGGILVLFIYVASLASNEIFSLSTNTIIWVATGCSLIILGLFLIDPLYTNNLMSFQHPNVYTELIDVYNISIFKIYNLLNYILTIVMLLYLLLALIIVANIVTVNEGPLRPLT